MSLPEIDQLVEKIDTWTWELNTVFSADESVIDKPCFDDVMDALQLARQRIVVAGELCQNRLEAARKKAVNEIE